MTFFAGFASRAPTLGSAFLLLFLCTVALVALASAAAAREPWWAIGFDLALLGRVLTGERRLVAFDLVLDLNDVRFLERTRGGDGVALGVLDDDPKLLAK